MNVPRIAVVATLARDELRLLLRQRWVAVYAAVFALLAGTVSYFGFGVVELTGWQEFDRTAASLLNLVLYLVPLGAMLMTVQSLRVEGGAGEQLFAEPITRTEIAAGKLGGVCSAQLLAMLLGFGVAGIVIGAQTGAEAAGAYVALVGFAALTGVVFVALASALTVLARRSTRAYAGVLAMWFVFMLLFDLAVIGATLLLPESWGNRVALGGVLLNPLSSARIGAMLAIGGREMFGPAGAHLLRAFGSTGTAIAVLVATLMTWTLAGFAATVAVLNRQDIT